MSHSVARPFGIKDKLGYLFGDFGNDFSFILSTMILLKFYTDIIGIEAAVVGIVMMLTRFVDAFTDIAMGRICDKSRVTPKGKFKPWILRMCGPVAIASFLIYQSSIANTPMWFRILWLFVTYTLWSSVFYTSVNIPYGSMASAISADPGERQSLSTFRSMGATFAGIIVGIGIPFFAYETINGKEILVGSKVTAIAGVFSVLSVICYLLCYYLCTERVRPSQKETEYKHTSLKEMLSNALHNRALISIIAASVVMLLAQLTLQTMTGYIYPDYYNNANAQSASTVTMMAGMILSALFAKPLAQKFGKAEVSVTSNLFAAIVCLVIFFIRPENVWVYVGLQTLCWLGLGFFTMVSWALITDVIDYSEIKNGIREDGSVYALYSFARKLGQALASGVSGFLLSMIGYSTTAAAQGEGQSISVLNGIFNISTLVPAAGFALLSLILWFWYPLHKKQVENNVEILKKKHSN